MYTTVKYLDVFNVKNLNNLDSFIIFYDFSENVLKC